MLAVARYFHNTRDTLLEAGPLTGKSGSTQARDHPWHANGSGRCSAWHHPRVRLELQAIDNKEEGIREYALFRIPSPCIRVEVGTK